MKKITRRALLTAKAYRPGKASGGSTKKKTYTLVPDISRREVRAVSPTGSEVGYLAMEKYGDAAKNNEVFNMAVKPTWQRQGIMTALHNEAEKHFGTINPSRTLSDDGFAFWKSYRPDAVKNSYRFHADRLMGKPVSTPRGDGVISSVGDKVMIAEKDGGTTFMVPNEISGQMFEQAQTEAAQEQQPQDDINKATGGGLLGGYTDPKTKNLEDWQWKPLSDVQAKLGGLSEIPSHVLSFGQFMDQTAQRAAREGLRPRAFTKNIRGIGPSKSGFVASLMGRGDQPTLDARQIILHTGNPAKEASRYVARKGGEGGAEAVNRLATRQEAMNLSLPQELSPYYQHLAHHAVWDKAGDEETTHQDVMQAMQHAATGGKIEPNHVSTHPVAQIMKAMGFPGLETEAHKADGGEIDDWHGVHEREAQHFADGGSPINALKPVGKNNAGIPENEAVENPLPRAEYPYELVTPAKQSFSEGLIKAVNKAHSSAAQMEIPIDQIVTDQNVIGRSKLYNPSSETVFIEKIGNTHHLRDGNHRVAAAFLRGDKTISAKVADMNDAIKASGRTFNPETIDARYGARKATGGRAGYADGGSTGKLPARVVNFKNFYSRGAEAARQLSQKKGSPQQMRAMLVKAGVKPEEFAQSGFDEAFSGKPSVTSEELFQHFYSKMPNIGVDKLLSENHSSYDASDPDAEPSAQYEDYTLPGIVNYREHRLRLPETNNNFSEQKHWPGQKNVVAHIRMGDRIEPPDLEAHDRTVEKMLSDPNLTQSLGTEPANWGSGAADLALSKGTITKEEAQNLSRAKGWRNNVMKGYKAPRALHVEEIQSDWAQAGREHGFQDLSADGPSDPNQPPQGPFVNSTQGWTSLALKHALTEAVNGGYNKLVLSPGQANADMYGLYEEDGSGMKSFYDQILPIQMNKLAKSLDPDHPGVQMFSHDLPADYTRDEGYKGHALEITDGLRDAVKKGLPMYKDGGEVEGEGNGDMPAQNAADHIAFLLREDRAKEVTDDLMGQADPKRLHEHYESGNTGMQMPMDEDSRMDRAKALGFDVKAYRGQTGDPGASLNTVRTEGKTSGTGSWATSDPDIAATYSGRENPVSIPMMIKSGGYQAHDFGGKFWGDGPEGKTTDELARASSAPGVHFKNITDVGSYLWNRANVQKRIPETADSFAIKDPKTVRSMFARFDPRLAHLSHLSAATGGAISEKANGGGVNRRLVSSTNPMVHKAIALARNLTRR